MHDTAALLDRARAGDGDAIESLLSSHRGRLLALLRVAMPPALLHRVDPEDVLQETLAEAARKLVGVEDRGPGSFYRWLAAIARFKLAEARRAEQAKKRRAGPLEHDPAARRTSPSGRFEREERAQRLREALGAIEPDQAHAVRLRYLEGLSVAEAAATMDRSASAVKALVGRGLAALAARLPRDGAGSRET